MKLTIYRVENTFPTFDCVQKLVKESEISILEIRVKYLEILYACYHDIIAPYINDSEIKLEAAKKVLCLAACTIALCRDAYTDCPVFVSSAGFEVEGILHSNAQYSR